MEAGSLAPTVPEQTASGVWVPENRNQMLVPTGLRGPRGRPHLVCPVPPSTSWGWPWAHLGTWAETLGAALKPVICRSLEAEMKLGGLSVTPPTGLSVWRQ